MGTENGKDLNNGCIKDVKISNSEMKDLSNIKSESPFTTRDQDYNGGRENLLVSQVASENIDVKNVHIKSEHECSVNVSEDNLSSHDQKFSTCTAMCSMKCENDAGSLRSSKRKACFNICIKQEAEDNENCNMNNQPLPVNPDMIKVEDGCTDSGYNSHSPYFQTFKCNKCNTIFTDKQIYSIHYKHCASEVPSSNTRCLISQQSSNFDNSQDLKQLIEKVREHPCLYNVNNTDYINTHLKNILWSEIAAECNFLNGLAAKSAWNKLITSFRESLNHSHMNVSHKHFKYQKQMEFLLPYINNSIPNDHLNNEQTESTMVAPNRADADDVHVVHQLMSPAKKQKVIPTNSNETSNANLRSSREAKKRRRPSSQPLDMFFLSMCETIKSLPPHLQIRVKKKVFQAVIEAEEAAANEAENAQNIQNEQYSNIFPFHMTSTTTTIDNSSSSQED